MSTLRLLIGLGGMSIGILLAVPVAAAYLFLQIMVWATTRLARALEPESVDWTDLLQFDEEIGWRPRPDMDVHCLTTVDPEVFHVTTDARGWPGTLPLEESNLVVIGDSFAFGYGVDAERSFVALTPGHKVKAIAAPGYSMVHGVLLMRSLRQELRGKPVIWMVYYGNDLFDNLSPRMNRYRTPFVIPGRGDDPGEWEIVADHLSSAPWRVSGGKGEARGEIDQDLHTSSWLSKRAFSASEYLVREAKVAIDAVGGRLILFTLPSARYVAGTTTETGAVRSADASRVPDEAFSEIGERLGVSVVHGSRFLTTRHYRTNDPHWNAHGHARVAHEIARIHEVFAEAGPSAPRERRPSSARHPENHDSARLAMTTQTHSEGKAHVSVVTPVYNGAAYLAECIESVRRQTYQQWDYVIVDNCSTDETGEIAEAYAARDPRIRVVHNSRLLPIMENWNLAMRQIAPESRYCKMVHADDWIYPECLERMVSLADRHPTVGIVASLRIRGERLMPDEPARDFEGEVLPGEDVCRMRLLTGKSLFGSPTSVMFRSDIVRSRDKFFNEDNIRADAEAGFDVLQDYDLGFVPEVLTHTRTHEDSVTSQNASLGTNMLGDYLLGRRFIPRFFDGEMADKLLRERTDTYYMYLATSLAFGRWKTWKYHRDGLDRLGLGFEARELARAFLNIARRAAGAPKVILKGLAHRAPMEQYLSELQGIAGYRRKTSVRWRSAEPTGDAAASAVDLVWEEPA